MSELFDWAEGRRRRDDGIQRALDHAERTEPRWADRAHEALMEFIASHQSEFMGEHVRGWAHDTLGIPKPPHARAWGGVMARAAKQGLIVRVGFAPVSNPKAHCAPCSVWRAASNQTQNK